MEAFHIESYSVSDPYDGSHHSPCSAMLHYHYYIIIIIISENMVPLVYILTQHHKQFHQDRTYFIVVDNCICHLKYLTQEVQILCSPIPRIVILVLLCSYSTETTRITLISLRSYSSIAYVSYNPSYPSQVLDLLTYVYWYYNINPIVWHGSIRTSVGVFPSCVNVLQNKHQMQFKTYTVSIIKGNTGSV